MTRRTSCALRLAANAVNDSGDLLPLESVGPFIERHAWFPQRINAHFVEREGASALRMRTWERGSGITMACGTGASAVVLTAETAASLGIRPAPWKFVVLGPLARASCLARQ